ncbi:hypothetical protein ACQCT3_05060 [Sutcliffiella horikoshii]
MKTSMTRNQEERSPHRRYEDISDEKYGEERSLSPIKPLLTAEFIEIVNMRAMGEDLKYC